MPASPSLHCDFESSLRLRNGVYIRVRSGKEQPTDSQNCRDENESEDPFLIHSVLSGAQGELVTECHGRIKQQECEKSNAVMRTGITQLVRDCC